MSNFSQDIQNFQRYGAYTYKFDDVGNLIFDSSSVDFSQVYMAFPLKNTGYNNSKINTMYNIEFEEFLPQTQTIPVAPEDDNLRQQLDIIKMENDALKLQLESVISQCESNTSVADIMAAKQVILELRKAVGEGRVESDFSEDFPYTPVRKNEA